MDMTQTVPRCYPYCDVVVGLAWSNDPKSNVGGSLGSGRVSHAGKVKGDDPDEKGYPDPPRWGLDVRTTSSRKKFMSRKTQQCLGWELDKNGDAF
jgi:hypothetical protein